MSNHKLKVISRFRYRCGGPRPFEITPPPQFGIYYKLKTFGPVGVDVLKCNKCAEELSFQCWRKGFLKSVIKKPAWYEFWKKKGYLKEIEDLKKTQIKFWM